MNPSLSVVIPCYNSEGTIALVVQRLREALADYPLEIILVNDGSRDRTGEVILDLVAQYPEVTAINLMRNFGQHNALLCGIRAAKHELIVTLDDDLQNPPEEVPRLLARLAEGYDVVYGTPAAERHGLFRNLASQVTKMVLQGAMGAETARKVSAFRTFRSQVRGAFEHYSGPFVSIDVLLTWGTTRFSSLPVRHEPRTIGKSNYTLRKLIVHALNLMTGFSVLPLQLASMVGFMFTFLGLLVLVYVIGRYLIEGGSVPGFPFLASIIAIFSGAQLFALGILGEYIARIFFRSMDKPSYVVREVKTSCDKERK